MVNSDWPFSCNGENPKCKNHIGCYKNGGPCTATTDIKYAKLYVRKESPDDMWYEELKDERIRISEKAEG